LTVRGIQGHIAYPQLAKQSHPSGWRRHWPNWLPSEWDRGNAFFPPTSWQVSNIHGGTGAGNVIPGTVVVDFNFRFSPNPRPKGLQQRVAAKCWTAMAWTTTWLDGGRPALSDPPGDLVDTVCVPPSGETGITDRAVHHRRHQRRALHCQICPQVIELGPPNATIHKIDEHVVVADIEPLKNIYRRVLENLDVLA
jgi:succinyl-diaminopimelate desuccinylase